MRRFICACLLLLLSFSAQAIDVFNLKTEPLPIEQAYQFSAQREGDTIKAQWQMAPGYYLYQERFCFLINGKPISGVQLPQPHSYSDSLLGNFKGYENTLTLALPLNEAQRQEPLQLQVCYQGCSSTHFCYPPVVKQVNLPVEGKALPVATPTATSQPQGLWLKLLSFFGLGLLLAFTPCILPMLPILSSLVLGQKRLSALRGFSISFTYVMGMAFTYALIGIVAGLAGTNLQTLFQTPLAISLMSLLFIILALSLFGLFEIGLPQGLQHKLMHVSNQQKSGSFIGAAVMGALATLIVSPCVSPALVGAVAYITQSGNYLIGGLMLWVMALGMGLPLILVGTFGAKILPHTGPWMKTVKTVFGVLMLMVAILLLSRIVPSLVSSLMWAALLIISSVYLGLLQPAASGWSKFWRGVALLLAICGGILILSAAQGSARLPSLFKPAASFTLVHNQQELTQALHTAAAENKITMIDFYANWCLSCKEMDWKTFNHSTVKQALAKMQLVRVDISQETPDVIALKKQYQVLAPPTMIFINAQGQEISGSRIVGGLSAQAFLARVPG